MRVYTNKYLTEVVCKFAFVDDDSYVWDSAYFGQYFDKIKDDGFVEREERKGIQVELVADPQNLNASSSKIREADVQMVFRDKDRTKAIIVSRKSISLYK